MLTGKLHEIRTIYDQNNDIVQKLQELQIAKQPAVLELEAKFGYYSEKGFTSTVPYVHYERLLNLLRTLPQAGKEIIQESNVAQAGTVRRITIAAQGEGNETVIWQRKTKLKDFDFPEYDVRVSANKEETLFPNEVPQPFNPIVIRERTRHSFTLVENLIKIDLTEVMMRGEDKVVRPRYEVELEFLGSQENLQLFSDYVDKIFKWLRGTNLIYTNTVKDALNRDIYKILGGSRPDLIDKDVLVEARNIKRRDLVYGGIVGNSSLQDEKVFSINKRPPNKSNGTNYMITFKADGLRKMLIIHSTGIWLVYPPFEFNLVLDLSLNVPQLDRLLKGFNGTVFDGELVEPKAYKPIAYWYLAFDCLSFRGNASIQGQPYLERQKIVNAIAGTMKTPILTIDTKETKEITSPQSFFRLVREFLDKRDALEYKEDGLIFIPIDVIYNPYSQNYALKDRSLMRIPDNCKWKEGRDITIDFAIKWIENGRLELYSYDDVKNEMIPFRGDVINPLTPEMIDYKNPLTLNKPTNLIVEYEWVKELDEVNNKSTGILRPRRIRYDKPGPNRLSIALDNWEDTMNPITEEDIRGDSLMMTFSYHNRIKKSLYSVIPRGSNILDIGSGRGGDVAKWISLADRTKIGTGLVVAVEPNEEYRAELATRINIFNMQTRVRIVPTGGEDTVAITQAVREFIPGGKVDAVTLMLSMSFFWASDSHLDALINTIITNLKPGGMIVFLTVDGTVVDQIFEPALGGPHLTDKTIATAKLHLYPPMNPPFGNGGTVPTTGQTKSLFGRPLDFILPDTIVGDQREFLVKLNDFTSRLNKYGIVLHEVHRAEGEKLLSESNSLFSSMYSYGYYTNDDKIALTQHDQTVRTITNIPLPIIPTPATTKYPTIKMDLPTPPPTITIMATPISPKIPVKSPPKVTVPIVPPLTTPQVIVPTITTTVPNIGTPQVNIPTTATIPIMPVIQPVAPKTPGTAIPTITFPTIPMITKLTKFQIERNQLSGLPVAYTGKGGRILAGPAINDDTYAPLTCTWYKNLVRIATIGEGSCFVHATLKAFYRAYQENNSALFRLDTVAKIRRDLAMTLGSDDPKYPGHTYWETSARGSFPRMVMQQINDEDLVRQLRVDYSLAGLQRLFNSTSWLGDEVYSFVADALNVDIYILRATQLDLFPHLHTRRPGIDRNGIVVIGNTYHYEVLAVDTNNGFQTVFPPGDPFLRALTDLFIGDGDFNDIVNNVPYDPDEAFINDVAEIFITPTGLVIPKVIEEIFPETDPFRRALTRLMPRIEEAARNRIAFLYGPSPKEENPVLARLDTIIKYLLQSGFSEEQTRQIREIVVHKLDPNIPQDLDAILASAETDGLLDHDTVQAIANVEATL